MKEGIWPTNLSHLPLTLLPDSRGAVGGPDDADALAVTAAVTVDADADVGVTTVDVSVDVVTVDAVTAAVTAAVMVDVGADVVPAVIVDADDDADEVTAVVTVDAMLQLIMLSIEQEFIKLLLDCDLQKINGILICYKLKMAYYSFDEVE